MPPDAVEGYLPLSPAVFHVLLALADEDRHGYAIMRDIADRTGGLVRVGPGMMYGSIRWLVADGLVVEVPPRAAEDDRRRVYRLTPFGRSVLVAETRRLEAALKLARARRVLSPKPGKA
jgi:DNA-binding PadR family transcriptional regulator